VFGERSIGRLRLEGAFLSSLKTQCDGRLIWGSVNLAMMQALGEDQSAIEGFVERSMELQGSEIAVLFVEELPDQTRISLRSREPIAVDGLARHLGGGGHKLASGVVVKKPLAEAVQDILQRLQKLLTP
jgi:phosphoesterase RecJ-like protein